MKACEICSNKCFGHPGNHGGCCTVADRDFIIGPHADTDEFLDRLSEKFDRDILYKEVLIDFEEGKNLFPNKTTWQNQSNYPALRLNLAQPTLPCIFYNTTLRACSIYEIRPETCKNYFCDYLKNHENNYK